MYRQIVIQTKRSLVINKKTKTWLFIKHVYKRRSGCIKQNKVGLVYNKRLVYQKVWLFLKMVIKRLAYKKRLV